MLKLLLTLSGIAAAASSAGAIAQQASTAPHAGMARTSHDSVNTGVLTCTVAGGAGFVFGSTKALSCIFAPTNGVAERYDGEIERFGVDVGYTRQAHLVWRVLAPGIVGPGALAGRYAGVAAQAALGAGVGGNALTGGSNRQISLQPVSVVGAEGLNVAGGLAEISLHVTK
jgi:hypothetical protein